ncbi:hypothetical protein B296_00013412 [Ensete ventricosum]|uniref:Uncharacterized protein n=1 Tax=Ensete ventricosum TaxID=4639 RepID=A0A427AAW9_ENSVE|nr:hypothetical protein B296_00013412 [Ensete ventricosum]
MIMNLKDGSRCIVNRNEDLTAIDFDDDVSLAENEVVVLSTAVNILTSVDFDGNDMVERGHWLLQQQRGVAIAAATTRAVARAVSKGAAGEEGELSVEKVAMATGAGEEEIAEATAKAILRKASCWQLMGAEGEGHSYG